MDLWTPQAMTEGQCVHWRIGPLDLWAKAAGAEWHACVLRGEEDREPVVETAPAPEDLAWRRWAADVNAAHVAVVPVMPDRSVVVRPADPLQILPGQEARFFVGVPVWVRLMISGVELGETILFEEHTVQLSNSWFGVPTEGELCYGLRTRARRGLDELTLTSHRAVCPLVVRNECKDVLNFERLCLHVRQLGVYRGHTHMWTNEGLVLYRGEDALSRITMAAGPPPFDEAGALLGPAREVTQRGFAAKAFGSLKGFSLF